MRGWWKRSRKEREGDGSDRGLAAQMRIATDRPSSATVFAAWALVQIPRCGPRTQARRASYLVEPIHRTFHAGSMPGDRCNAWPEFARFSYCLVVTWRSREPVTAFGGGARSRCWPVTCMDRDAAQVGDDRGSCRYGCSPRPPHPHPPAQRITRRSVLTGLINEYQPAA
jgi:hypothetical protein